MQLQKRIEQLEALLKKPDTCSNAPDSMECEEEPTADTPTFASQKLVVADLEKRIAAEDQSTAIGKKIVAIYQQELVLAKSLCESLKTPQQRARSGSSVDES